MSQRETETIVGLAVQRRRTNGCEIDLMTNEQKIHRHRELKPDGEEPENCNSLQNICKEKFVALSTCYIYSKAMVCVSSQQNEIPNKRQQLRGKRPRENERKRIS